MRDEARADRVQRHLEIPLLIASAAVIPAFLLMGSTSSTVHDLGVALNWLSWGAFAAELVAMLALRPQPWLWAREHPLRLLIVLGSFPLFPAALSWLRLFRLFRAIELLGLLPNVRHSLRGDGVRYPALSALFVVVLGGLGLTVVEPKQNLSVDDGIWWSVQTVTTVGYGDIVPETNAGRLLGAVVMLTGIGIVGYVTAHAAERFTEGRSVQGNPDERPAPRDREIVERLDAVVESLDGLGERLRSIESRLNERDDPPPR